MSYEKIAHLSNSSNKITDIETCEWQTYCDARVGTAVIGSVKIGAAPTPGCAASPGAAPT